MGDARTSARLWNMKNIKKGFTLGEMLICIGILAVVAAIVMPATLMKKPDKNRALFRKAYYNMEKVIYELANDETLFPQTKFEDYQNAGSPDLSTIFAHYEPSEKFTVHKYNGTTTELDRTVGNTTRYLCEQIVKRLNTVGNHDCNTRRYITRDESHWTRTIRNSPNINSAYAPAFVTTEGVFWFLNSKPKICAPNRGGNRRPDGTYNRPDCLGYHDEDAEIYDQPYATTSEYLDHICFQIDVNGDERPNCRACAHPDRFQFCVMYDGKMEIPQDKDADGNYIGKEAEYLRSNKIWAADE